VLTERGITPVLEAWRSRSAGIACDSARRGHGPRAGGRLHPRARKSLRRSAPSRAGG
jgi:hypothetical protein